MLELVKYSFYFIKKKRAIFKKFENHKKPLKI